MARITRDGNEAMRPRECSAFTMCRDGSIAVSSTLSHRPTIFQSHPGTRRHWQVPVWDRSRRENLAERMGFEPMIRLESV